MREAIERTFKIAGIAKFQRGVVRAESCPRPHLRAYRVKRRAATGGELGADHRQRPGHAAVGDGVAGRGWPRRMRATAGSAASRRDLDVAVGVENFFVLRVAMRGRPGRGNVRRERRLPSRLGRLRNDCGAKVVLTNRGLLPSSAVELERAIEKDRGASVVSLK